MSDDRPVLTEEQIKELQAEGHKLRIEVSKMTQGMYVKDSVEIRHSIEDLKNEIKQLKIELAGTTRLLEKTGDERDFAEKEADRLFKEVLRYKNEARKAWHCELLSTSARDEAWGVIEELLLLIDQAAPTRYALRLEWEAAIARARKILE